MKTGRHYIILISFLLLLQQTVTAQKDSSGIFLTATDFVQNRLLYSGSCKKSKHKLKLNDFFGKPYLTIKHCDSIYRVYKKQIFGYKWYDGNIYRFKNKKELLVLNPSERILIYKHVITKPPTGLTNVTNYYFSKDAFSVPVLLTYENLKKQFPDSKTFIDSLRQLYRFNTQLASYDNYHHEYSLNVIYKKTITNQ